MRHGDFSNPLAPMMTSLRRAYHDPRRSPHLRVAAGRPRRAPSGSHAILRHAQFAITTEIYTVVSSAATRAALKKLGESLDG